MPVRGDLVIFKLHANLLSLVSVQNWRLDILPAHRLCIILRLFDGCWLPTGDPWVETKALSFKAQQELHGHIGSRKCGVSSAWDSSICDRKGAASKPDQPLSWRVMLSFLHRSGNKSVLCPRGDTISFMAVCYSNILEKIVQGKTVIASSQKPSRNVWDPWKISPPKFDTVCAKVSSFLSIAGGWCLKSKA